MKLTLIEANKLKDFISSQCVSYYEAELREAMRKMISNLEVYIEELATFEDEQTSFEQTLEDEFNEEIDLDENE